MSLPCIFSLICADFHTEHEENIIDLYGKLGGKRGTFTY